MPAKILYQDWIADIDEMQSLAIWDTFRPLRQYPELSHDEIVRSLFGHTCGVFIATILEDDLTHYPEDNTQSVWHHVGIDHKYLGQLYWNYFHATQSGTLAFADAPDFSGTLHQTNGVHHFWGDIGMINAVTWMIDIFNNFQPGDLWITVRDERHQVILEAQSGIRARQMDIMREKSH